MHPVSLACFAASILCALGDPATERGRNSLTDSLAEHQVVPENDEVAAAKSLPLPIELDTVEPTPVLAANNRNVSYTGRFVLPATATEPALFAWPFTQMACTFRGAKVAVDLKGSKKAQIMRIMVDGNFTRYLNVPGKNTRDNYVLATGLDANTDHQVRLWKVTDWEEDTDGYMRFYSFSLPSGGTFQNGPSPLSRKLEFIGDSDTAYGQFYGNQGCVDQPNWVDSDGDSCKKIAKNGNCQNGKDYAVDEVDASQACCGCGGGSMSAQCTDTADWVDSGGDSCHTIVSKGWCSGAEDYAVNSVDANQACCGCKNKYDEEYDATQNWAAQLSSSFGAEMMVEAVAGYGATNSAGGNIQPAIDDIIPYDTNYAWDYSKWTPDAVMILIGPNDNSASRSFETHYMNLLKKVANKYANAAVKPKLINVCGGSGNGEDPCAKIKKVSKKFTIANIACADTPNWEDSDGDSCKTIVNNGYCDYGADYAVGGVDASKACCGCGGGENSGFESYYTTISHTNFLKINKGNYVGSDAHYNTAGAAILVSDIRGSMAEIMGW